MINGWHDWYYEKPTADQMIWACFSMSHEPVLVTTCGNRCCAFDAAGRKATPNFWKEASPEEQTKARDAIKAITAMIESAFEALSGEGDPGANPQVYRDAKPGRALH